MLLVSNAAAVLPNGHAWGCLRGNISASLPFCDDALSIADRVKDLVSRLTLEEKIGVMSADSKTGVNTCNMMGHGVLRLGIPPYMHLVETNTAVASSCLGADKCSTNYPGPTGLGASFNRTLWGAKGHHMGEEIRAFNNLNWYRGTGDAPKSLIGLNGYGPNMNIARDPRYGRTSEVPGEDPYLTGQYAVAMVRGGQGAEAVESGQSKYLKMTLGLKHYDLYSVEEPRASFIPNVTAHDLWETFLPQYAMGFSHKDLDGNPGGGAMATMCSYAGLNGIPSCANDYLLNQVIRTKFGRPEVVVGTDCGAVQNMYQANHYAKDASDAAAKTLNGGCDMELGDQVWSPKANGGSGLLAPEVAKGTVTEARIDESVARILGLRFITGQFDPVEGQPYTQIGAEAVNSTASQQLNLEAALQSFVLLKNENSVLPFKKGMKTAILGPHVTSKRDLMSDYKGDMQCAGGGTDFSCFPSIAEAFTRANGATKTMVEQGVDLNSNRTSGIASAIETLKTAQQVLLFIGIGNTEEHEGIDRHNTTLPGNQEAFTLQVLAKCKALGLPVAVVLINGGALAIDNVIPAAPAIVEAFYPSVRGAEALTMALFGEANRWGKLPITMYDADYINQVDFHNFEMAKPPGRTYKYYTGAPLYPFGHGLSYSTFGWSCDAGTLNLTHFQDQIQFLRCTIEVLDGPAGDEVLLLYHSAGEAIGSGAKHPVPIKELVGFERVHVSQGAPQTVTFAVGATQLGLVDQNGNRQLVQGDHVIEVSSGDQQNAQRFVVSVGHSRVLDTVPPVPAPYSPPPPPAPQGTWMCAHSGSDKVCRPTGGTLSKGDCMKTCK